MCHFFALPSSSSLPIDITLTGLALDDGSLASPKELMASSVLFVQEKKQNINTAQEVK